MAYDAIRSAKGVANRVDSPAAAIKQAYDNDLADEFILPTIIDGTDYTGMKDGDGIMMCNFRRSSREILTALASPDPPSEIWEVMIYLNPESLKLRILLTYLVS